MSRLKWFHFTTIGVQINVVPILFMFTRINRRSREKERCVFVFGTVKCVVYIFLLMGTINGYFTKHYVIQFLIDNIAAMCHQTLGETRA